MDMTYGEWMILVDASMRASTGLTSRDIADWNYRDAYDDEMTPRQAAEAAINNEYDF